MKPIKDTIPLDDARRLIAGACVPISRTERIAETHTMRYLFIPEIEALSLKLFRPRCHYAWMSKRAPGFEDWAALSVLERQA